MIDDDPPIRMLDHQRYLLAALREKQARPARCHRLALARADSIMLRSREPQPHDVKHVSVRSTPGAPSVLGADVRSLQCASAWSGRSSPIQVAVASAA